MKKMRHMKRNALVALVLSVTMLLTLMPGLVFGVSDDQGDPDTVSSSIDYPTVNFNDVAPFLPPVSGAAPRRSPARAAGDANTGSDNGNNGMAVNKTSVYNEDTGAYDITLEAYATGSKIISTVTSDVPTDIVLVLDQSGSMGDNFSTTTSDSWVSYGKRTNDANYNNRMNGRKKKDRNLYYKLSDGGYAEVLMDRSKVPKYTEYNGDNAACYGSRDTLYTEVNDQHVEVEVSVSYTAGTLTYTYTYTIPDGPTVTETSREWWGHPPFPIYKEEDVTEYAYTYYYNVNGTRTDIGTSTGADTVFETELYQKIPSGTKITRLEALKNAAATFANAVEEKAKGADGVLGTEDDISHRIAVVGFASKSGYGNNTELLSIAGRNSDSVGVAYDNITNQNLKDVLQEMNTSAGQTMVSTAIDALAASGATRTDLGLDMAQRILSANPVQPNEKRNRVVIVFTDGAPTSSDGFETGVADKAITYAGTIKTTGATVYTIGIFAGADATSAGTEPKRDLGQNSNSMNSACNWFMQQVSSNNGKPRTPSYYLSAADAGSLSNIFQQISDNIETGGSSSTLTEESVVRDIISPQFTLPAGSTVSDITLETYACTGKDGDTYTWRQNDTAMGATATIDGNSVSVTGFDFSENYVGTVTNNASVTYRGHKLVIRFSVKPQPSFLGGNNVPTNAGAGVYENKDSETPVREFPQPTVNVPIQPVTVAAQDYNVYLLGGLTASQLQSDSTVQVGSISLDLTKATDSDHPYGLEPWQTAYVDITVSITGPDGSPVTDLAQLRADTSYAVSVTVSPKTEPQADSSGTPAAKQSGSATGKVSVFKPTLTYEDGTVYYGDTFDRATLPGYRTSTSWFHNGTDATAVSMTGAEPKLNSAYSYDTTRLTDIVNTKQDIPVKATISIGDTNITADTAFLHTNCAGETWSHTSGDPAFLLHVRTCALTVTKTGGADGEPYVFNVYRNGDLYTQVTVVGSSSVSLYELPVGKYTIAEDTGWSWRYDATYMPDGCALTAGHNSGSITCTNTLKNDRWLNGFSDVIANIFGIRH
ncbi:vWA domain-containing protein [Vescimonas sp.]|uniref:vWA domain-containing protein n=1 Tax=Vescimonas sp. TaxID=2892404 RepID=UPI003078A009